MTHPAQEMIQIYYNPRGVRQWDAEKPVKRFRIRYSTPISMWVVEYGGAYMAQRQTWTQARDFVAYQTGRYQRVRVIA